MKFIKTLAFALAAAASVVADSDRSLKAEELTAEVIPGAATDCSEYQYRVQLAEDVSMSYVITTPSNGDDATMSVELVYEGEAWVSFAVAPDDKGKMIGSEAVIGLAGEGKSKINPGKYIMDDESLAGVYLRDDAEQTLTGGSIDQENGRTIMTFTKKLKEEGEIEILSQGQNVFQWAVGYENEIGLHDKKDGTGTFILDVIPCVPPATTEQVPVPAPSPTQAPNENVVETPTEEEEKDPQTPTEEDDEGEGDGEGEDHDSSSDSHDGVQTDVSSTGVEGNDSCYDYQNIIRLADGLNVSYVVNVPSDGTTGDGTLSVKLEYDGEAWISIGTAGSDSGKMIGSEAVIALPDEPVSQTNPGKYHMISEKTSGVFLMDDAQQTLIDGSIVQADGKTIMTYTKKLSEANDLSINGDGVNTFVWAYGYNNDLNLHLGAGAFTITLEPCTQANAGSPVASSSVESLSRYSADQKRRLWLAHAYMGLLAWAVFAPVAIAISWLRKLIQDRCAGPLWLKLHMYLNMLVFVLTISAFGIAVALYRDAGESLFRGAHGAVGLTITILITLQAAAGIFRPPAPKNDTASEETDHLKDPEDAEADFHSEVFDNPDKMNYDFSIETGRQSTASESTASDSPPVSTQSTSPPRSKKVRAAWEVVHKLVGLFLLFMGLWQVQDGIILFTDKFGKEPLLTAAAFWGWIGGFSFLVLLLTMHIRMREIN